MNIEEEVLRIKNKLSKMSNDDTTCRDQALDLLRTLRKMPITVELLTKTRIGLTVNTFRKSNLDCEVISLAKEVLRDWKKLIPAHITRNFISSAGNEKKKKENSKDDVKGNPVSMSDLSQIPIITTDAARLRCRELLENALVLYGPVLKSCTVPNELAAELEDAIYQELKDSIRSCKKCLQRKERRERSKQMMDLRNQKKHSARVSLGQTQNLVQKQILGSDLVEIHQPRSNLENLLQRLQQLSVSNKDKEDITSS